MAPEARPFPCRVCYRPSREGTLSDDLNSSLSQTVPELYHRLRESAAAYLGDGVGAGHTLQPTAVLHEALLRLSGSLHAEPEWWRDPERYFDLCTRVMRQVLVDYARRKAAKKRTADARGHLPVADPSGLPEETLLLIDSAIDGLREFDEDTARVVELKFYMGLTSAQVAKALGRSLSSVERDWRAGRAWLRRRLEADREEHTR